MSGGPRAAPPAAGQGAGDVKAVRAQLDLMEQDAARVSAPDYNTPFASLEDAVDRLLPYHMFGAEEPQDTDAREVEALPGPARLATSRHEAWHDYSMHRVNECGAGLALLEKRIRKAEVEALQRSQLPLLMLQSYATAEAQALVQQERNRRIKVEQEAEQQRQAAIVAAQQKQQQALVEQQMRQQQMMLAQQQQLAAAAAGAAAAAAAQQQAQQQQQQQQQQQLAQIAAGVPQAVQQQAAQQLQQPPGGMQPMQQGPRPAGFPAQGMQQQRPGQPPGQPSQPAGKPMTAAEQKAAQLAQLKARVLQRK